LLITANKHKRQTFARVSRQCLFANRYGQGKKITLRHILALLKCNFEKHKKE